jgi:cell division protease FtsH
MSTHKNYSEATAVEIDNEIRMIVDGSYQRALTLLKDNIENLHNLSECLIEKENLSGVEVDRIIAVGVPTCGQDATDEAGQEQHADIQA